MTQPDSESRGRTSGPRSPIRVAHLITDLDVGGTEMMLARLVGALDSRVVTNTVISLASGGTVAAAVEAVGVPVVGLGMRPGRPSVLGLYRAFALLRKQRPDVIQTWLYHADFVGLLLGTLARVPVIVWNLRCATIEPRDHPVTLPLLLRMLAWMSGTPRAVVCNSPAAMRAHQQLGYHPRRWVLIPNGFDTDQFRPSQGARLDLRRELGLAPDVPLVGLLARYHPMKDHVNFIDAAAVVARHDPHVRFVLAGRGVPDASSLVERVSRLGLGSRVHLLGEQQRAASVLAALDVAISSSYSESFPNVVAEAMACGTPVVATATGDATAIVGDTGRVVPARDAAALARGILDLLAMPSEPRRSLGLKARDRIIAKYSLAAVADQYEQLYEGLCGHASVSRPVACAE